VDRWATFDCYGTLIDWERGINATLSRLWPAEDHARLMADRHSLEAIVERDGSLTYLEVLARTLRALAIARALPLPEREAGALGDSLPSWPPFPEVPAVLAGLRTGGWKLAILSNTDPDLLDASIARLGVQIDLTVVASKIGSYKPCPRHWEEFRRLTAPGVHVHVAASVFHDLEPCATLGIPVVWINRHSEETGVARTAELPTLDGLLDRLEIVAGASQRSPSPPAPSD
jgi:2-haloacid dehalogenase